MVELVRDKLESYGRRLLPDRHKFLEVVYRMVARVYLDPRNLKVFAQLSEEARTRRLRRLLGLPSPWLPRDCDLAWMPSLDVKRALNTCRERLALTKHPLEILWIFHELCKHFLEVRRFDLARYVRPDSPWLGIIRIIIPIISN
jgi:hypothetical protein